MDKTHTSALVIIPPKECWPQIQAIREKYDRKVDRWMPHVNLMYPFLVREDYDKIKQKLKNWCQKLESFEVHLHTFRYFKHRYEYFTLWLRPRPKKRIIRLQHELLKVVPECNDVNRFKGGFKPHLSVGQAEGSAELSRLMNEFQENWKPIDFMLEELHVIRRKNRKKAPFHVGDTIPLGS